MTRDTRAPQDGGPSHIRRDAGVFWCGRVIPPIFQSGHFVGLEHTIREGEGRKVCELCIAAGIAGLESIGVRR